MYRNNKGRFISKQRHEYLEMRRFKMFCFIVIGGFILGIIGEYHNSHEMPHVVETAQAVETVETVVPDWDPCGLHAVVCADEEPVQNAINALQNALGREITEETKKRINYLYERATEHSVPFYDAVETIYCESMWYSIQSGVVKNGVRENSWGLAQIHLDSHSEITKEQALDAYFAIDFMVERWNDVKWYGYDRNTSQCTNGLTIEL